MTATWVLLRGLTREVRHWGDFPQRLAAALPPTARIEPLDLPGNGALWRQRSPARVDGMVASCRAQLQARGVAPPYRLVALSLGAMVAIDWAARHPTELAGMALINTSVRPFSPFWQRLQPGNYGDLARLLIADAAELQRREATVLRLTSRLVAADAERSAPLLDAWQRIQREAPVSRANALRQLIAAARFAAPRSRPAVPLLLLASTRDGLVDVRCSRRLAQAWGAALIEHPQAGHDLPLDDAAWVVAALGAWAAG